MSHSVNKTFEELLWATNDEFKQWAVELRKTVVYAWDVLGLPPRIGFTEKEMIDQFQKMESFPVGKFLVKDEYTGEKNVVRNTHVLGNAVNDFFPTMCKVRINYTNDAEAGRSIYDFFSQPELLERFTTYARRHFRRDSFYHYSVPVKVSDIERYGVLPVAKTGVEWIQNFEDGKYRNRGIWDYWLASREIEQGYTGYNEELKNQQYLRLSRQEIEGFGNFIPEKCRTNVDWERGENYLIRVFEKGQRVFPIGLKAFRISFSQYAVNYPPLTAKYIYERLTEQWKHEPTIYCWDPSAGWGGRLLGALSVEDGRHITYLGNDPNTDHNTTLSRTKYHEIYNFYCEHVHKGGMFNIPHNDFKFWQLGSEVMQLDPEFQKYRGKLSLVFTSPPYFSKERYSEDPEQSCIKFSQYDLWRDGFLKETLKTAVEWLRPGGYLAWNISDCDFSGVRLPLEKDSCDIMESLGMIYVDTLKLSLAQMPGGNRLDPVTGLPKTQHFCKVSGLWLKWEPIFIYKKPS